jgi:hypothetical protein
MAKTVVGLYDDFESAEQVVRELTERGHAPQNISLIANDADRRYTQTGSEGVEQPETTGEAAAKGAGWGAAMGGIAGLLVGIGTFMIPGIGPVVAAGPLIATLSGAGVGALAGGLVGSLTTAGVPDEDANIYAEGVRRGGTLVSVYTEDAAADQAADIMNRHNPVNIEERSNTWRKENWTRFNDEAEPFAFDRTRRNFSEQSPAGQSGYDTRARTYGQGQPGASQDWNSVEPHFRQDYDTRYAQTGRRWEEYRDFYRYGFDMGREERYANQEWDAVRADLRRDWETRFHSQDWSTFEDAVYEGWRTRRTQR